jgi:Zn-dependent protease
MDPRFAVKIFEFIVLLFALSFHEAAHGWTASRLGDPTARMLGRVTLNPAKHIDPFGTILLPLITLFTPLFGGGGLLFGWAKPTPVTGRNFRNYKRDDMLVTLAGPASNLLLAIGSFVVLLLMERFAPQGREVLQGLLTGAIDPNLMSTAPVVFPLTLIFYFGITLNLVLAVFNLMPFPPLDLWPVRRDVRQPGLDWLHFGIHCRRLGDHADRHADPGRLPDALAARLN